MLQAVCSVASVTIIPLQSRLSELHQKGAEAAESRVMELLAAMEKIQGLLDQVSREKDELQMSINEESFRYWNTTMQYEAFLV